MTSSWFLRYGALQAIFHDGFSKSDHDLLIAYNSNFYLGCMVSEITRFYCKPDMTSSRFLRQGAPQATFLDGFWKSDHDFLMTFYSNFLVTMPGFRDNKVLFQTGYDVIVISRPGALQAIFHDGIWKSDHDFLIAFHVTFLGCMVSEITRFYCKTNMTSSWFLR